MKTIYKSAWIHIVDRKVLFLRGKGKDAFYIPGGKREVDETDEEALIREIKEELSIFLLPESITEVFSFIGMAHGQEEPTQLEMKCYQALYEGSMQMSREIEAMAWWTTQNISDASEAGVKILHWLKEQDLID